MKISEERKYVLVSKKWSKNNLVFWGNVTKDEDERSFGGYTDDLNHCERYTLKEVERFLKFEHLEFMSNKNKDETYYATVEELVRCFSQPTLSIIF